MNGFSLKKFGKIVGFDGGKICSWEVGENMPIKEMLKKLDVILRGDWELASHFAGLLSLMVGKI